MEHCPAIDQAKPLTKPSPIRRPLPWCEPAHLVQQLAHQFGAEGLVWLDGDGSGLGRWSRIGVQPLEQQVCRGLPGTPGAGDPFAALAAIEASGGQWTVPYTQLTLPKNKRGEHLGGAGTIKKQQD